MSIPITYVKNAIDAHEDAFTRLKEDLAWLDVAGPRLEYYNNSHGVPYRYGKGAGSREYVSQPSHDVIESIRRVAEKLTGDTLDVCFLNMYRHGKDSLGWHADDSPEMDNDRAIVIVSLGSRREIYFRPVEDRPAIEKVWLEPGSICIMHKGMQVTHEHKIPRASFENCGPRISLTFRGYVTPK